MINGRRKGNAFEREVCKLFGMWWNVGKFERRSMGLVGSDIITPSGFPWSIEAKHVKSMRARHFWKPTSELNKFWQQAKIQSKLESKSPLLIMKVEGVIYVVHWMLGLKDQDYMQATIGGDRVVIQTIDGFFLDAEFYAESQARLKAA